MCNWRKWIWPGVLATILLTALALQMKSRIIEQDLQSKAMAELSENYNWAAVELDGRDLTLSGQSPSEDAITEALQLADDAYDVRVAKSVATLLPIADPFAMSAVKADNKVVLSGSIPDDKTRKSITDAAIAAYAGSEIVDEMKLARGAPEGFGDLAEFGIGQLTGLNEGIAKVSGSELSVEGIAKDKAAFDAVQAALAGALPGGGKLAMQEITAPPVTPYTFSAVKNDSGIVLEGYIPDETTRATLVNAAKATTSGLVTDNLQIGSGEAEGFVDLAGFGIGQLAGFSNGSSSLSDQKLSVKGTALTTKSYDDSIAALSGSIPGNGTVVLADITRNTVSPYTFASKKDEGIIVLDGYVSSQSDKDALVAFAGEQNPGDRVIDRLTIANGAPDGVNWLDAAKLSIKEASQFSKGSGSLSNDQYRLEGMAKSNDAFKMLTADADLPAGLKLVSEEVRRPIISPYVWSFTNLEGSAPTLSGYVPQEDVATEAVNQIQTRLGTGRPLDNSIEIGAGAPVNFASAASVGIQSASRLINGKASITGTELMVTGEALSEDAAAQIRAQVENGLPPGFTGKHEITLRQIVSVPQVEPEECQTLLISELEGNSIRFETAKSVIKEESFGLLDRLAFVIKRCSTATIEISGHTDSDGSAEYNQSLSEDRANAVRSYMVNDGIFVGRLKAVGYGESKPVGDNATEEGKAMNRRIDFTVVR